MDWSLPDQVARAELNAEQVEFVRQTSREIDRKGMLHLPRCPATANVSLKATIFREIRGKGQFEHDYYFISQLYDLDWKPRHTI